MLLLGLSAADVKRIGSFFDFTTGHFLLDPVEDNKRPFSHINAGYTMLQRVTNRTVVLLRMKASISCASDGVPSLPAGPTARCAYMTLMVKQD